MRFRIPYRFVVVAIVGAWAAAQAASSATASPAGPTANDSSAGSEWDSAYLAAQQLFDQLAPPEVKADYEFPSKEQWDAFAARLQAALDTQSLSELAGYAPQARALLTTLRTLGADEDLADWLEQRLDELEAAQQARIAPRPPTPSPPPPQQPSRPSRPPQPAPAIPHYDLWLARVHQRPVPPRAAGLVPTLRQVFAEERVPLPLVWLAEAESSFNPTARSPAGARGLFQLMPETARTLGLGTFLPDERTHPEKSARAAAGYLRVLHGKFGDWPLALAAYNAGEGRVSRALARSRAKDFAGIADTLPAETRMYVPKVCALVAVRSGVPVSAW